MFSSLVIIWLVLLVCTCTSLFLGHREISPTATRNIATGRYLAYDGNYGRYNNQLMSFMNALCLGQRFNRTVVFPGWIDKKDSFNLQAYVEVLPELSKQFKYIEADQLEVFKRAMNLSLTKYPLSGHKDELSVINEIDTEILDVGIVFYVNKACSPQNLEFLYSQIIPNEHVRKLGDIIINKWLQRPFAALHLRKLEGKCKQTFEEMRAVVESEPKFASTKSFFLASDREDKELEMNITNAFRAIMIPEKILGANYMPGILDAYIMAHARVLYMNAGSTLSMTAVRYKVFWLRDPNKVVSLTSGYRSGSC